MNRPVLIALSSFRWSQRAIHRALEDTEPGGLLIAIYVVDLSAADFFTGVEAELYPDIIETCTKSLLEGHLNVGRAILDAISTRAKSRQVGVQTHLVMGRFTKELLRVIWRENPRLVITSRYRRPQWEQHQQGEAIASVAGQAGCPLIEL